VANTALITGIAGQDGSYLAELLLEKGYRVVGMDQRSPSDYLENIEHIKNRITLLHSDLIDQASLMELVERTQPDEIYNLAAQSFIPLSWEEPVLTGELNALGVSRLLEAIRRIKPDVRFYQASSSEMFGKPDSKPQDETTPFRPGTPYGTAKLYGHWITANYRDKLGLYACSGILYNHESPRRGRDFVTRKITLAAARIKQGLQEKVALGNLDAQRDWGYAFDYVNAMWLMLQQDEPDDYVIATGEEHSVRDIVRIAFQHLGLDWQEHVEIDPRFFRPVELNRLVGSPAKAERVLGWRRSTAFEDLIKLMVDTDLERLRSGGVV
jgi:GDPmannose 4,6-dehydratase